MTLLLLTATLTPSNAQTNCNQLPLFWEIWLRRASLAHTTPPSLGPPHCPLLAATRVLLSKGLPLGPVPRGAPSSPGHHSTDEVQQQQAEGAQVLRGHGVAWSRTLSLPCRCVRRPALPAQKGRLTPGSLAGQPRQLARPLFSCRFPGAPEPASSQAWANRRRGHHTRPPLRSQSARYTSPPRRRGQPIRQRNCGRGLRPMGRGDVRGSRRPKRPATRREFQAERGAPRGNPSVHQSRDSFPVLTNCL